MSNPDSSPLALHGGQPVRNTELKPWPAWPVWGDAERAAVHRVLETGAWWYGENVAAFEREYAAFQGAGHCVSCTSGTTALEIVLQALSIGAGDEVIVPPYTFFATASSVLRVGATPVFVDLDESWNMDPEAVEPAITPRTRAIICVHFGGRVCDMDHINAIGAAHNLEVVEDACHSWGSRWRGRGTGTLGRCGVFSFQHSKNITAGEGGAIVTDDEAFALHCKSLTNCGRDPLKGGYLHINAGTNARLTEFQAAILRAQLGRLEEQTRIREENGNWLNAELSRIEGIVPQPGDPRITRRAYHLYCMRIDPPHFGCSRQKFIEAANAEGLPIGSGYPMPLYRQPVLAREDRYARVSCPVCEDLCDRSAMWFRHGLLLGSRADMRDIVDIVRKVRDNTAALTG